MKAEPRGRGLLMLVRVVLPPGAQPAAFKQYALDELRANVGHLRPEDPLFELDRETVGVELVAAGLADVEKMTDQAARVLMQFLTNGAESLEHVRRDGHRRKLLEAAQEIRRYHSHRRGGATHPSDLVIGDALVAVCEALAGVTS